MLELYCYIVLKVGFELNPTFYRRIESGKIITIENLVAYS